MCGVDKALFMLRSMNFYWRQNPIIILRNELRTLGLDYLASSKIWNNTTSNFCNIQTTSTTRIETPLSLELQHPGRRA